MRATTGSRAPLAAQRKEGSPEQGSPQKADSGLGRESRARGLTKYVRWTVPGHEARVVPVARTLLEEALTEVLAKAAACRHQPVIAAAATAAGPGVGLREAAEHGAGYQPPVREDREHRRRRPPKEAGGPRSGRTRRPGAGSLFSRSRAAARALLRAARGHCRRPCPPRGASHTPRRAHRSQSEVKAGGTSASVRLGSRLQPPLPPPSSAPLACSGPRREHRPLDGPAHSPAHYSRLRPKPRPSGSAPFAITRVESAQRVWTQCLLGVVVAFYFTA